MLVKGLNHVELLMPADQVAGAASTFGELLGVAFPAPHVMEDQKIVSTLNWDVGLEILAPSAPDSPVQASLARNGGRSGGVGPIAWRVESVDAMREHAEALGIAVMHELSGEDGMRAIYLSPQDCHGYVASFIEKPGDAFPPRPPEGATVSRLNRIELLTTAEASRPAADFFGRLLGTRLDIEYLADHDVLSGTSWEAGVEVFAPGSEKSVLNASLARKGERGGIGPIVWEVEDIDLLRQRALSQGHHILYQFSTDERHQVCLSSDTLYGYTLTFTQMIR